MKMSPETVLRLADLCDGWTILCPDQLKSIGLPDDLVESLADCLESDPSDGRESIYSGSRLLLQAYGVYSLKLLEYLASHVSADMSSVVAFGRGTRARQFKQAIREALSASKEKNPPACGNTRRASL
ncbi:MAG: hypothetical protein R3C12_04360 [Planctomycetaceae bacterium]|nr:hypothetical protein [Planctomycetaceae bacterium]